MLRARLADGRQDVAGDPASEAMRHRARLRRFPGTHHQRVVAALRDNETIGTTLDYTEGAWR